MASEPQTAHKPQTTLLEAVVVAVRVVATGAFALCQELEIAPSIGIWQRSHGERERSWLTARTRLMLSG